MKLKTKEVNDILLGLSKLNIEYKSDWVAIKNSDIEMCKFVIKHDNELYMAKILREIELKEVSSDKPVYDDNGDEIKEQVKSLVYSHETSKNITLKKVVKRCEKVNGIRTIIYKEE